jgi:hypothetical protein
MTMAPKAPPGQKNERLIRENERLKTALSECRRDQWGMVAASVIRTGIKWGFGGLTIYYSIAVLAGKSTLLDAKVDAAVDVCHSFSEALEAVAPPWWLLLFLFFALVVATLVISWRTNLYRKLIVEHGDLRKKYELLIDPTRTSSQLARDGQTHRRDDV